MITVKHNGVTYKATSGEFYEVDITDVTGEDEHLTKYQFFYALTVTREDIPGSKYRMYFYPDNDEPSEKSLIYGVWDRGTSGGWV